MNCKCSKPELTDLKLTCSEATNSTWLCFLDEVTLAAAKVTSSRKQSHVELVASEQVNFRSVSSGFEHLQFIHNALPEMALSDVDTSVHLLGKDLHVPILISSMTG